MSGKKRNAMLFVLLFTLLLGVIVPVQAQSYGRIDIDKDNTGGVS